MINECHEHGNSFPRHKKVRQLKSSPIHQRPVVLLITKLIVLNTAVIKNAFKYKVEIY